ncbi:hypothetical protein YN1_5160 [Nanoarchaeota archaeon]
MDQSLLKQVSDYWKLYVELKGQRNLDFKKYEGNIKYSLITAPELHKLCEKFGSDQCYLEGAFNIYPRVDDIDDEYINISYLKKKKDKEANGLARLYHEEWGLDFDIEEYKKKEYEKIKKIEEILNNLGVSGEDSYMFSLQISLPGKRYEDKKMIIYIIKNNESNNLYSIKYYNYIDLRSKEEYFDYSHTNEEYLIKIKEGLEDSIELLGKVRYIIMKMFPEAKKYIERETNRMEYNSYRKEVVYDPRKIEKWFNL